MNLMASIRVALRGLSANKLRGFLTMLGVIIGVAAVIALMSIGNGAQQQITNQVGSLGTNLVFVTPGQAQQQGNVRSGAGQAQTLTYQDAQAIESQLGETLLSGVSPERNLPVQLIANGQNWATQMVGVVPAYQDVHNFYPAEGAFVADQDVSGRTPVIVLGSGVAAQLFDTQDPIGQNVRVSAFGRTGTSAKVIGVMESKGGSSLQNQDNQAFMPLSTVITRLNPSRTLQAGQVVGNITVEVTSQDQVTAAVQQLGTVMEQQHHTSGTNDDFVISSQQDYLAAIDQITGVFTAFLGAIAGISLVVGGIGIMNIELVSVTERTREIGIRKAVGARRRDILAQFLIEAVVVSLTGGALGIAIGTGISQLASTISINGSQIPSIVAPSAVVLAFGVSAAIGLVFGTYPAMRAARLNPIDALRYE